MDDQREWAQAWARFNSLRTNFPFQWSHGEVMKYHDILAELERASREDLSAFRIAESEMKPKMLSATRATYRRPGHVTMSNERYCSEQHMRQQMEGVVMYFDNLQAPVKPKTFGF